MDDIIRIQSATINRSRVRVAGSSGSFQYFARCSIDNSDVEPLDFSLIRRNSISSSRWNFYIPYRTATHLFHNIHLSLVVQNCSQHFTMLPDRRSRAHHSPETINASLGPTVCMFPIFGARLKSYPINPQMLQACFAYQIFYATAFQWNFRTNNRLFVSPSLLVEKFLLAKWIAYVHTVFWVGSTA